MKDIVAVLRLLVVLLAVPCGLTSCTRIKAKVKTTAKDAIDKVHPVFDASQPDTKYNKKRFEEFFKVKITPDVKGIYCNAERLGQDATYHFVFNCNKQTAQQIIEVNDFMLPDAKAGAPSFSNLVEFDWWQQEKIDSLPIYFCHEDDLFRYFWYDSINGKAYYLDFDI